MAIRIIRGYEGYNPYTGVIEFTASPDGELVQIVHRTTKVVHHIDYARELAQAILEVVDAKDGA